MPAFTRILCPVDLYETSAHAITDATALASSSGASLTLQYVYVPMFMPVPGLPVPGDRVPAGEMDRVLEEVRMFATAAGAPSDIPVVVDVGRPADEILARAVRDRADLIVMGTHGSGGFAHLILGSVTERVLRLSSCPVLTVPPRAQPTSTLRFQRIVCAVDFSEWSLAALDLAASLAQEGGAALTAVHAVEWPWPEPPAPTFGDLAPEQARALLEFRRYMTDRAASRLGDVVRDVVAGRCEVKVEVAHGKPYVALMGVASAGQADLIVLGVHGRSTLDLALLGSTTNQVVRHATCPVLTVRR